MDLEQRVVGMRLGLDDAGVQRARGWPSTREGVSAAGVDTPTQISAPGSWSRQSSLQTTGSESSTGRLYTPPVSEPPEQRGPRLRELGLRIGELEPGPTDSIADVAGVQVGHVTVWRDEPVVARTRRHRRSSRRRLPLPAGMAVLNGAGELTGSHSIREWGLLETPVYLTSTLAVGRIYDGAVDVGRRRREPRRCCPRRRGV